jgi:hypothetical protein
MSQTHFLLHLSLRFPFIPSGKPVDRLFIRPFFTVNLYDVDIYTRRGGTGDKRHEHTGSGISTTHIYIYMHPAGSRADPAATVTGY